MENEIENQVEETEEVETEEVEEESSEEEKHLYNKDDVNLQRMRELKAETDRINEEQAREIKKLRAAMATKQRKKLSDDDIVEGKDYNQVVEDIEKLKAEVQEANVNARLHSEYNDYSKVMTQKNIDKFIDAHPELAATAASDPNKYTQYKTVYWMMKQTGVYKDNVNADNKKIVADNKAKPIPSNAIGSRSYSGPLTNINLFKSGNTEEIKAELRRQNLLASKNY